jgi:molybdate transport system substrate-binding protein
MATLLIAASIVVSAAASLTDVLGELAKRYEAATGERVQINTAGSNTLARQIVQGAPVDLFISADEAQMDVLQRAGRLVAGTRAPLLRNRLVVIAPIDNRAGLARAPDLAARAVTRVALANPDAVPAGVYARQWLQKIGLWSAVEGKVVPLPTVRAALAAVREGRAEAGIVYATDARTESRVRVVFEPDPADAPSVVYPAAVVVGPNAGQAARFLAFLRSPEAASLFEAAGFLPAAPR